MILFLLIYQLFASNICYGEDPDFYCQTEKPYKSVKNKCANFIDMCVKKDDSDCKNFQSACQQCPPSNYSIIMFIDIMKMKNELITTKSQLKYLTVQIENHAAKTTDIYSNQIKFKVLMISLSIVIVILEVRFKIFAKLMNIKENKYKLLQSRNRNQSRDYLKRIQQQINEQLNAIQSEIESRKRNSQISEQNIDTKAITILTKINSITKCSKPSTKFDIEGCKEPINYNLNCKDTVIKIKRELCEQFIDNKNYKLMKMIHDDIILDDNANLFNKFGTTINCIFDMNIDADDILVLKLLNNIGVLSYFQINKSQTITDLKTNLESLEFTNEKMIDYKIFKESEELKDDYSLANLNDDDCLYLINDKPEELNLSSIFMKGNLVAVNHSPVEKIAKLKIIIADQFNSNAENYFIFLKNQYLDETKYLFQYKMNYKENLQYCCLKRFNEFSEFKSVHKEAIFELFTVKFDKHDRLIKKYCLSESKNLRDNKYLLKELATFRITKSQSRFVQLLNIYKDKSDIYVAMENMEQGTVINILKKDEPIKIDLVSKWTEQILEGLMFLHNKKIIFRALSPSCILVNKYNNIKLHGLNLSKYTNFNKISSLMSNYGKEELPIRYLSPEILTNKRYNELTDVWSLGAVLIFITSGKDPFPNIGNDALIDEKWKDSKIEYQIPDEYKTGKLGEFIDCCLKYDSKERLSCFNLSKHKFIDKQQEN